MIRSFCHIFILLLLTAATPALVGCSDPETTRKLERAEQLMEEHPDSARALLDGIDSLRLSKTQGALYGVLDAQSRHKLELPVPSSDSLLTLAVDRYAHHGPDSLLMKALFYRAIRYQGADNAASATGDATLAWEIAQSVAPHYWRAKIAEQIGDIYRSSLNMSEECAWRRIAMAEYAKAGRIGGSLFATCDLIAALIDLRATRQALRLIDSIAPLVEAHPEVPTLNTYFYSYAVPAYTYHGDASVAQALLDSLSNATHNNLPAPYQIYQARVYMRQGKTAQAIGILNAISPQETDSLESLKLLNEYANCYAALGDYERAYRYYDTVVNLQTGVFHGAMANPASLTQRDVYQEWYNISRKRGERGRLFSLIGIGCVIVGLMALAVLIRLYRRRASEKFEREVEAVKLLHEELVKERMVTAGLKTQISKNSSDSDSRILDLQTELDGARQRAELQIASYELLYRQKWDILNSICKEIYSDSDSNSNEDNEHRLSNLRRRMSELRDMADFGELEKIVDAHQGNLISRLREQCPFLSDKDIMFLTLLLSGQSAKTVAFFTGIRLSYVYTKRNRLCSRIEKSEAADREEFCKLIKEA